MSRYIAFLRAVNVGGHIIKMEELRKIFESLGYSNVETFIASGNVIFETNGKTSSSLEKQIEKRLQERFGYEVKTFVRTDKEVAAIASHQPFLASTIEAAAGLNIGFLTEPMDDSASKKLMLLKTEVDDFHINGREIYWLCKKKQSESTFSNLIFQKSVGKSTTFRGANTIKRMADRYCSSK